MNIKKQRRIRSFVIRGRVSAAQQKAFDELWVKYGLDLEKAQLDLTKQFKQEQPCVLEIGFGMGESLLIMAEQQPNTNFLGIEVHRPGVGNCLAGIQQRNLDNLRIINTDVMNVLNHAIAENSLDKVQLFFPDPWPKRAHHKRRLVQISFIELVARKLKAGGLLHIATDWQDYADHCLNIIKQMPVFSNLSRTGDYIERPDTRPLTKFEARGLRLGHVIRDMLFERAALAHKA